MQRIKLSALTVFKILLILNILFFVLFYVSQYYTRGVVWSPDERHPYAALNVGEEVSVPTWYNQLLLLVAGLLLLLVAKGNKQAKKRWAFLGVIFIYLSIDEGASLHELLVDPMRHILGVSDGIFYYAWVIPFAIAIILLGIFYFSWYISLPLKTQIMFGLAFLVFVVGAVGVEMFSAAYITKEESLRDVDWYMTLGFQVGIEEFLEMLGVTVFIYAVMDYISNGKNIKNKFTLEINR